MNKLGYILFNNQNVIGIFNDEEIMNNYIDGCIQNNFFNRDTIKIEKYTMNSLLCHDKNILKKITNKNDIPIKNQEVEVSKVESKETEKKI